MSQPVWEQSWAFAEPMSAAQVAAVKRTLTEYLAARPDLDATASTLLTRELPDLIGTLEVERVHLEQGAKRFDILRRELLAGEASDDLLDLVDMLYLEWALYVRDRASGQPNPTARLVQEIIRRGDRIKELEEKNAIQADQLAGLLAERLPARPPYQPVTGTSRPLPGRRTADGGVVQHAQDQHEPSAPVGESRAVRPGQPARGSAHGPKERHVTEPGGFAVLPRIPAGAAPPDVLRALGEWLAQPVFIRAAGRPARDSRGVGRVGGTVPARGVR